MLLKVLPLVNSTMENTLGLEVRMKNCCFCYYSSHPSERGYRKRLTNLWTQRNSTLKFNEQHLCGQALSLLKRKYFSDIELQRLQSRALGVTPLFNQSVTTGSESGNSEMLLLDVSVGAHVLK